MKNIVLNLLSAATVVLCWAGCATHPCTTSKSPRTVATHSDGMPQTSPLYVEIHFTNAPVFIILNLYESLTQTRLLLDSRVAQGNERITFDTYGAKYTNEQAAQILEGVLREQAEIVITHQVTATYDPTKRKKVK